MGSKTTKLREELRFTSEKKFVCRCGCASCPDCVVTEEEFLVRVSWVMSGYASVMASSPEEAADKARSEHHSLTMYEEAEKLDESFEVDSDDIILEENAW